MISNIHFDTEQIRDQDRHWIHPWENFKTAKSVTRTIKANLYYTGLTDTAQVRQEEGPTKSHTLARDYSVKIEVEMKPESFTWFLIE